HRAQCNQRLGLRLGLRFLLALFRLRVYAIPHVALFFLDQLPRHLRSHVWVRPESVTLIGAVEFVLENPIAHAATAEAQAESLDLSVPINLIGLLRTREARFERRQIGAGKLDAFHDVPHPWEAPGKRFWVYLGISRLAIYR